MRKTNLFKGRAIKVEGKTIRIKLDNSIQLEHLNGYKEELMLYLRTNLNNRGIILEPSVVEVSTENMLYTSEDKYRHLAKKNPALEDLKKKLGLENGF